VVVEEESSRQGLMPLVFVQTTGFRSGALPRSAASPLRDNYNTSVFLPPPRHIPVFVEHPRRAVKIGLRMKGGRFMNTPLIRKKR
jgi:hypothetical protein